MFSRLESRLFYILQRGIFMEMLISILLLVIGFVFLVKGADFFVDGAASIASKLGIPELVIGLTIVAMGTSAPEAAVSIAAAFRGSADITVGNIIGSNVLNTLIILGLSSVIIPLAVKKSTIKYDIPFMIAISVIFLLLGMDNTISHIDGVILSALFIAYLSYMFVCARNGVSDVEEVDSSAKNAWQILLLTVGGLALIIAGSNFAVDGATRIARAIGISERFIGLTIVALGTSLPELFTSVSAAHRGNADIAIGNIVGSNIFNILFVIGISALVIPVPFSATFTIDCLVAIAASVLLLLLSFNKRISRIGGATMLLCYAAYFVYLIVK